jgi:ribosomal-protein-alanine N-acetyltransferase
VAAPAIIETSRLLLRPFTLDDVTAYAAIRAKPEVMRFFPATDEAPEVGALRVIAHFMGHWQEPGYGPWAAIDKRTGRLIGHLGLRYMPEFGETEILYILDSTVWRQGLASEGAAAARDHAFDALGLDRVMAIALPGNVASTGVMTKIGMRFEKMATYKGIEVAYYALDKAGRRTA